MDIKILMFLILAFAYANAEYKSFKDYKVYSIIPMTRYEVHAVKLLMALGIYEFWTDALKEGVEVRLMVTKEQHKEFEEYVKSLRIEFELIFDDVQKLIDHQQRRPPPNRISGTRDYHWNYYQTLEEIHEWLREAQRAYPDVVTVINMGESYEGREILGVKIDYKKQANATIGMMEGGIHAREWISPATVTWMIKEFLTSTDPEVRALAENVVWHMFPVVNPDGYSYTFTTNRMWRKNRNPASLMTCSQWNIPDDMSIGVDLNRNFGFVWNIIGASINPCLETYAGPTQNSELETIAIINYVNGLKQEGNFVYYLAYHSYSQMMLIPYSHLSSSSVLQNPLYGDLYEIGVKAMDKIRKRYGTEYKVGTAADILYEVSGASFDWVSGIAEVPIVYLFELRDVGQYGFLLPPEYIIPNSEEILDGLLEMDRITRQAGYYTPTASGGADKFGISVLVFVASLLAVFKAI